MKLNTRVESEALPLGELKLSWDLRKKIRRIEEDIEAGTFTVFFDTILLCVPPWNLEADLGHPTAKLDEIYAAVAGDCPEFSSRRALEAWRAETHPVLACIAQNWDLASFGFQYDKEDVGIELERGCFTSKFPEIVHFDVVRLPRSRREYEDTVRGRPHCYAPDEEVQNGVVSLCGATFKRRERAWYRPRSGRCKQVPDTFLECFTEHLKNRCANTIAGAWERHKLRRRRASLTLAELRKLFTPLIASRIAMHRYIREALERKAKK